MSLQRKTQALCSSSPSLSPSIARRLADLEARAERSDEFLARAKKAEELLSRAQETFAATTTAAVARM